MNPSPGNIPRWIDHRCHQIGRSGAQGRRVADRGVLDYPEYATKPGFNLQCTPGNDVESVTAQVGAGSNLVLFTTGLGTPTGNPIAPVIKISTNSTLAGRMDGHHRLRRGRHRERRDDDSRVRGEAAGTLD